MSAALAIVHDPFHPYRGRELRRVEPGAAVRDLVPATEQPHIVQVNGQWLLREHWSREIDDGDAVIVVMLPQGGGGGSNPMKIVLMLAIGYFAPQIAYGMVAGSGATVLTAGQMLGVKLLTAGIGLVGNALVNALIPPPKPPTPHQAAALAAPSPTYSLQAQGNQARLGGPIPVQYGRMMGYPDFAAQPYAEYVGNEQFLYQLFCVGAGEYNIEAIRIDDTDISSWEEITYEVVVPGGQVTLFPANVITSAEVSGQDLPTGTAIGPYTANSAGTQANAMAVDLIAPRGLYHVNATTGALESMSITVQVEAREIDDTGAAIGVWTTLGTETMSGATTTPQRYSYRYNVPAGRYEVRCTRTDTEQTASTYGHDVVWGALRAYLPDTSNYGNVTLIAMRMKATSQLSAQASRKINVVATRKLRVWDGSAWSVPQATRSIAWALADAAINEGGVPESRVDLAGLLALDATWSARGDHFDGRFDGAVTLWEAWTQILSAGRAKPFAQGGILYAVRDQSASVPVCLYSMRNIKKGSFGVEYILPTDETADAIDVGYFDASTWSPRRVQAALPGSAAAKPVKIDLFGVTDRDQAYREGLYQAAANKYRRKMIRFATEMEGFIPAPSDLIAIAHDMPQWGQTAEAVAWDAGTLTLTVSEQLTWGTGTHYIGLRQRDGSLEGPIVVTAGATAYEVVLSAAPTFAPYTGADEERTHIAFGWGETWRQEARVVAIRPRGLTEVEIEAINEDPSVHTADQGMTAPPVNSSQLPTSYTAPVVAGLTGRSSSSDPTKMLLSWQPAAGADHYLIEQSQDDVVWTRTAETSANNYAVTALYGNSTIVRVAAVGLTRGPWVKLWYSGVSDYMWTADANAMWTTDTANMWTS